MMTDDDQKAVSAVLDFWFGAPDSEEYGNTRMEWFIKDDSFDDQVRTILLPLHDKAVKGELNHWVDNAWSGLALCIVLDQAPRNIFRNSSLSFASDAKAREIAHQLVSAGLDQVVLPVMRTFIYLPFEHSEILEDQKLSMKLFGVKPSRGGFSSKQPVLLFHQLSYFLQLLQQQAPGLAFLPLILLACPLKE